MVSTAALIAALQGQFTAARQGQGGGSTAGLPGLLSSGTGEAGSGINALTSGGISGGGVPTTATTGQSVASGIGGGGDGFSADPITQQVLRSLGGREPGERGDLGAGVTGGDLNTLLSVLSGPGAIAGVLGSLVASNALGQTPTTSLNSLLDSGRTFEQSQAEGREFGGVLGQQGSFGTVGPGTGTVNTIRQGNSRSEIDRGRGLGAGTRNSVNSVRQGR